MTSEFAGLKSDGKSMGDDRKRPAAGLEELKIYLKKSWSEINPDYLRNLGRGMPERIEKCILLKGGYIGK